MSARLPWHCGNCTRNAEAELFQAVASAPRARCSQKQIAARCSARQAVVATSAAEPSMLMIGKRTTFWRTALAARTQSIIIFRPILSATITDGITTLRSFNGYSSSASGCERKLRRKQQSAKRSAKNSATTNDGAPDAANRLPRRNRPNDQDDIIVALSLAVLATEVPAQSTTTFYNSNGQNIGRATTSGNSTTFRDAGGRTTARSFTSGNTTTIYDPAGRNIGRYTTSR